MSTTVFDGHGETMLINCYPKMSQRIRNIDSIPFETCSCQPLERTVLIQVHQTEISSVMEYLKVLHETEHYQMTSYNYDSYQQWMKIRGSMHILFSPWGARPLTMTVCTLYPPPPPPHTHTRTHTHTHSWTKFLWKFLVLYVQKLMHEITNPGNMLKKKKN